MTPHTIHRLANLAAQLVNAATAATYCAREIQALVLAELDDDAGQPLSHSMPLDRLDAPHRPLLNESTMCVVWRGASVHLGNTVCFRLLGRLARRPNQYVTHLDLLQDVWDGKDREIATIRSTVRHLQRKLRDGGMVELAAAIRGHSGRYILVL